MKELLFKAFDGLILTFKYLSIVAIFAGFVLGTMRMHHG
jgi:hypothetical protein